MKPRSGPLHCLDRGAGLGSLSGVQRRRDHRSRDSADVHGVLEHPRGGVQEDQSFPVVWAVVRWSLLRAVEGDMKNGGRVRLSDKPRSDEGEDDQGSQNLAAGED